MNRFLPKILCPFHIIILFTLIVKITYTRHLVEYVRSLTNKWYFHFVVLVEVFFVVLNKQLTDFC